MWSSNRWNLDREVKNIQNIAFLTLMRCYSKWGTYVQWYAPLLGDLGWLFCCTFLSEKNRNWYSNVQIKQSMIWRRTTPLPEYHPPPSPPSSVAPPSFATPSFAPPSSSSARLFSFASQLLYSCTCTSRTKSNRQKLFQLEQRQQWSSGPGETGSDNSYNFHTSSGLLFYHSNPGGDCSKVDNLKKEILRC